VFDWKKSNIALFWNSGVISLFCIFTVWHNQIWRPKSPFSKKSISVSFFLAPEVYLFGKREIFFSVGKLVGLNPGQALLAPSGNLWCHAAKKLMKRFPAWKSLWLCFSGRFLTKKIPCFWCVEALIFGNLTNYGQLVTVTCLCTWGFRPQLPR